MDGDQTASISGRVTPIVKNGDKVDVNDKLGTVFFGDYNLQYATTSGYINGMLAAGDIRENTVFCNISPTNLSGTLQVV